MLAIPLLPPLPVPKPVEPEEQAWLDDVAELLGLPPSLERQRQRREEAEQARQEVERLLKKPRSTPPAGPTREPESIRPGPETASTVRQTLAEQAVAPVRRGPTVQSLRETIRRAFRAIQSLTLPVVLLPGETDPLHAFIRQALRKPVPQGPVSGYPAEVRLVEYTGPDLVGLVRDLLGWAWSRAAQRAQEAGGLQRIVVFEGARLRPPADRPPEETRAVRSVLQRHADLFRAARAVDAARQMGTLPPDQPGAVRTDLLGSGHGVLGAFTPALQRIVIRGQESIASPWVLTYQGGWSLDKQPELLAYRQDLNRLRETLAHELTHAIELTVQREAERLARRLGLDRWLLPATHPQVAAGWTALPLGVGRLAPLARRLLQAARQQPLESDRLRFLEKFLEYAEARDQALRDPLGVLFRLFMEDLPYRGYHRGLEYLPWLLSVQWPAGRTMPGLLEKLSSEERDIPALVSLTSDLQRRLWQAVARTPASPAP